ncbi:MAG: imidazoleglycerol-phosphate dehydratase HisB [Anaerofustis sp.]
MVRKSEKQRTTNETNVFVSLDLDGIGKGTVATGIGFLDHMMDLFKKHSGFDLSVKLDGDIEVDTHHSMEDLGIVLGQTFNEALGDKLGIKRFSFFYVPMDEALVRVCVDISGRSYLNYQAEFTSETIGDLETETVEEFLRAFSDNAKITLHVHVLEGKNNHHICEAIFKALAKALADAVQITGTGIPSTKGLL